MLGAVAGLIADGGVVVEKTECIDTSFPGFSSYINKLTKRDHVKSLRERHNSDTTCPKCGSRLVKRTAKRGKMAGKRV